MPGKARQTIASTRATRVARTPIPSKTSRGLRSACMMNDVFEKHSKQFTRSAQRKNSHPNQNRRQEQRIPTTEELNKEVDNYLKNVGQFESVGLLLL